MKKLQFVMLLKNLAEHDIYCLSCSYAHGVKMLPYQLWLHIDVLVTSSGRHSAKVLSKTFGHSIIAMVTDLWGLLTYASTGA